ncbi:hypothetical protein DFQ14_102424 [Halopolyspora algeriensis]|uniref:DUF6314 domain-containing protein n=1 Tax=Halopolyspora algeriensis TaxID=1500506 RepID=A0A368VZ55_9ACTN|nr:DUF6314 family protein [Halopolyspora algeriensis]RCW46122.1 hypothetical protein DFQ14_102424 [Halopolyspora algeriensis]TQM55525.1 hypothetical protein FHU43_0299 [Halopolyspora algeriensis]
MHPVSDLAGYLTGRWLLQRRITDAAGTPRGTFTGTATFTAETDTLMYHEQGTLQWDTYRGPAHRRLRYRIIGPGQAQVSFDYGDFFHDLDLRTGWWRTRHPCRDDLYRGEFHVFGPDHWQQLWTVAGPTKNHTLTTSFQRAGPDDER